MEQLTIATWNVFNRSRSPSMVETLTGDILAFQELTAAHIARLGLELATAEDFIEADEVTYLGLKSHLPTLDCRRVALNGERRVSPSRLGRRMKWIEALEALHLVYELEGEPLSVLNLHLSCAVAMEQRREQLTALLDAAELAPRAVILGDFNSFERWWTWPLLAPLTGARRKPIGYTEEAELAAFFDTRGFARIASERPTFPRLGLTLDHIFYRGLTALSHEVSKETFGSDHRRLTARFRI